MVWRLPVHEVAAKILLLCPESLSKPMFKWCLKMNQFFGSVSKKNRNNTRPCPIEDPSASKSMCFCLFWLAPGPQKVMFAACWPLIPPGSCVLISGLQLNSENFVWGPSEVLFHLVTLDPKDNMCKIDIVFIVDYWFIQYLLYVRVFIEQAAVHVFSMFVLFAQLSATSHCYCRQTDATERVQRSLGLRSFL